MTPEEIKKGISAYHEEQKEIIEAIKANGGSLHQDDFDSRFGDWIRRPATKEDKVTAGCKWVMEHRPPRIWPVSGEAFILGDCTFSEWSKYLELTQLMVAAGLLKQTGKTGNIRYMTL